MRRLGVVLVVVVAVALVLMAGPAQAARSLRAKDGAAAATWAIKHQTGAVLLTVTLSDRSRGPHCGWAIVSADTGSLPLHVCGARPERTPIHLNAATAATLRVCDGNRRHPRMATCRSKVLF